MQDDSGVTSVGAPARQSAGYVAGVYGFARLPNLRRVTKRMTVFSHFQCPICGEEATGTSDAWPLGASLMNGDKPHRRRFLPCECVAGIGPVSAHIDSPAAPKP